MDRKFVVLGGSGTIGRVVVRDLFESDRRHRLLVADFKVAAARAYAQTFRSRRVQAVCADARDSRQLARVLRGQSVVVNCTHHEFNLGVMRAALAAGVHYVDLGGLFTWTRRQLTLAPRFQRAGLTAVLGMGCAPGITNVLARYAADQLDRVTALRIRVGSGQPRRTSGQPAAKTGLCFPYSAQTIVEELTLRPWALRRGRLRQIRPRSGWERVDFGAPLGRRWTVATRHSELATLPGNLRARGLRECDFKVGFDRAFVREVMRRRRAGWTIAELAALPVPRTRPADCEITLVTATGTLKRAVARVTVLLTAWAKPEWRALAGDIDTGCPAAIVARMIAAGEIRARGVWAPETAVPVAEFFRELRRRGMVLRKRSEVGGQRSVGSGEPGRALAPTDAGNGVPPTPRKPVPAVGRDRVRAVRSGGAAAWRSSDHENVCRR